MSVYIRGLGLGLPGAPVSNLELAQRFALNAEWITLYLGNEARYFATDLKTGKQTHSLADLGTEAAANALADAGVASSRLDFVILATATPDQLMPATVNQIARRLRLADIKTYQLQSGCSGAIQALDLAKELLSDSRRRCGLVIGADVCNKFFDPSIIAGGQKSAELINYALFGDGAGAAVLATEPGPRPMALTHVHYAFTGRDWTPGQIVEWRGKRPETGEMLREDYKAIERNVPVLAEEVLQRLLAVAQRRAEDVQWFLPPQLSGRMTDRIIEHLGLPKAQTVNCVAQTGNNGNALPFFQLGRLFESFEPGELALGVAIESSRWLTGGFVLAHEALR